MTTALRDVGPVGLRFTGVDLSPGGVIACAVSVDGAADRLRHRLDEELGDDGWLEHAVFEGGRDPIWYCTLVHFAGSISEPRDVVNWVDQRAATDLPADTFDSMALCTWSYVGGAMTPQTVASITSAP